MFRSACIAALCVLLPLAVMAAGKRPADSWSYYHFDGTAFVAGPAATPTTPSVAVREKFRPVLLFGQNHTPEQTPLPEGSGVITGICYQQQSGGKLGGSATFKPYPRTPLLISSGGKQLVTVQTDDHGYFSVVLAAGSYTIGSEPFTAELTVERGITTLVPLRVGKRMVD